MSKAVLQQSWPTSEWILHELRIYTATALLTGFSALMASLLIVGIKLIPIGLSTLFVSTAVLVGIHRISSVSHSSYKGDIDRKLLELEVETLRNEQREMKNHEKSWIDRLGRINMLNKKLTEQHILLEAKLNHVSKNRTDIDKDDQTNTK